MQTKKGFKKAYPRIKYCLECGNEFNANCPAHRWCGNPCVSPKRRYQTSKYYHIVGIRQIYAKTKKDLPELAMKIKQDMIKEEGEEFTEMVLDGI